jgi:hypothetical protein
MSENVLPEKYVQKEVRHTGLTPASFADLKYTAHDRSLFTIRKSVMFPVVEWACLRTFSEEVIQDPICSAVAA